MVVMHNVLAFHFKIETSDTTANKTSHKIGCLFRTPRVKTEKIDVLTEIPAINALCTQVHLMTTKYFYDRICYSLTVHRR